MRAYQVLILLIFIGACGGLLLHCMSRTWTSSVSTISILLLSSSGMRQCEATSPKALRDAHNSYVINHSSSHRISYLLLLVNPTFVSSTPENSWSHILEAIMQVSIMGWTAESVNFALDSWIELGRKAEACQCIPDRSVGFTGVLLTRCFVQCSYKRGSAVSRQGCRTGTSGVCCSLSGGKATLA